MGRDLTARVFGFRKSADILVNLPALRTKCIKLHGGHREVFEVKGDLQMNILRRLEFILNREEDRRTDDGFAIINPIYSTESAIILEI